MSARFVLIPVLAVLVLATGSGCGGPSFHDEMRIDARKRLDVLNASLNYDQALQAFKSGQFEKAIKFTTTALAQNDEDVENHLLLGRIYIETNALEMAIGSLKTAQETDPELADPYYYSGIVYQRWSDDEQAYEAYRKAFELESSSVHYLLAAAESLVALERFDGAKSLIESKLAYFEHNLALRLLLGQIAMIEGRYGEAADHLEEAWLFNPEDDLLLEDLAHAQYAAGLFTRCLKSIRYLREASKERRPDLFHFEALCLTRMDRLQEARALYREATGLAPSDLQIWIDFGALAWELEDYHRVALCGARLTSLAPERYEGYLFKGVNERHHGNLDEAITFLRDSADRSDGAPVPYVLLGRTLQDSGDTAAARDAYEACLRFDPDNEPARLFLAQMNEEDLATVPPLDGVR